MARQNGLRITPSHGSVMYIDTGVTPKLDAAYIGYQIDDTTATTRTRLWVAAGDFTGGVISLANPDDAYQRLPDYTASDKNSTVFYLVKAPRATTVDQLHSVRVYDRRPDLAGAVTLAECTYTFTDVKETIKAASNKLESIKASTTTLRVGQTLQIRVWGYTGTVGGGSAPDNDIVWVTPAAISSWPTQSLRLESTTLSFGKFTGAAANMAFTADAGKTYSDQLLIRPAVSTLGANNVKGNGYPYEALYTFRILGPIPGGLGLVPLAQISSGNQIKHTDTSSTAYSNNANLTTTTPTINITATKSVDDSTNSANYRKTRLVNGTTRDDTYVIVPYRVTVTNNDDTPITLDELVDTPDDSAIVVDDSTYVKDLNNPVSVKWTNPTYLATEANSSPRPVHFVGPFSLSKSTSLELTYSVALPLRDDTYVNTVYAKIGDQVIGSSSNSLSGISVRTSGSGVTTITTQNQTLTPEVTTMPATSVDDSRATLGGVVDPNDDTSTLRFELSKDDSDFTDVDDSTNVTPNTSSLSGSTPTAITAALTALTPATTYYFRVKATSTTSHLTYYGDTLSFTTNELKATPVVTTLAATRVDDTTYVLRGTIDANLTESIPVFQYKMDDSTLTSPTLVTMSDDTVAGASAVEIQYQLSGLTTNKTYYYRIYADPTPTASSTNINGAIVSFVTGKLITPPTVADDTKSITGATSTTFTPVVTKDDSASVDTAAACIVNVDTCDDTVTDSLGQWVVAASGTVTFTPAPGSTGTTTVTYQASDNFGNTGTGTFKAIVTKPTGPTVLDDTATTTTTTPVTRDDSASAASGATLNRASACLIDPGDASCKTSVTVSNVGTWSVSTSTGQWTFTAQSGYTGTTSISYRASDSYGTTGAGRKYVVVLAQPLQITTTSPLPDATEDSGYSQTLMATGGAPPYSNWRIDDSSALSDDTLPSGMTLDQATGVISGTSKVSGTYSFTVKVDDASATSTSKAFSLTVLPLPAATTLDGSAISSVAVTFVGQVNPKGGGSTSVKFEYSTDPGLASPVQIDGRSGLTGNAAIDDSVAVGGLSPYTLYYYRIKAQNARGTATGLPKSVRTSPGKPVASTDDSVVFDDTAVLKGSVVARGPVADIIYEFSFGDEVFGEPEDDTVIRKPDVAAGNSAVDDSVVVSDLIPRSTYYYRVRTESPFGDDTGLTKSFTTPPGPPRVATLDPTSVTSSSATLPYRANARMGPNGEARLTWTDSATSLSAAGNRVRSASASAASGEDTVAVTGYRDLDLQTTVTGLEPATTYYYRASVRTDDGTATGVVKSFTTLGITTSSPLPNGTVNVTYSTQLTAVGGSGSYASWSIVTGALPSGLILHNDGVLSGKPSAAGQSSFTVEVEDTGGATAKKQFVLTVTGASPPPGPGPGPGPAPEPGKKTQTLRFVQPPDVYVDQSPVTLTATASSGLPVRLTSSTPKVCSLDDTSAILLVHGTCTITAEQPGDSEYEAAKSVTRSFEVSKRPQIIDLPSIRQQLLTPIRFPIEPSNADATPRAAGLLPDTNVALFSRTKEICVVRQGVVSLVAVGTCELFATSNGSRVYLPAENTLRFPVTEFDLSPITDPGPVRMPLPPVPPNWTVSVDDSVPEIASWSLTPSMLSVQPIPGFTGEVTVPVSLTGPTGRVVRTRVPVTVLPRGPRAGTYSPQDARTTVMSWAASPTTSVRSYEVQVNGRSACTSATTTCTVQALLGPGSTVTVVAIGNRGTRSVPRPLAYTVVKRVLVTTVYFSRDSHTVTEKEKVKLRSLMNIVRLQRFTHAYITGHTDSMSSKAYNVQLSKKRLGAVMRVIERVLQDIQVQEQAMGETDPVAPNDTDAGRAANRRVEISLW